MNIKGNVVRTILIQGAMDIEVELLRRQFGLNEREVHAGYSFYRRKHAPAAACDEIILCQTNMGIINGALSTMTGIHEYHPDIVINQGTAGAHVSSLHMGDVVVCKKAVYLNSLRMPLKGSGEGSDALNWQFDEKTKERSTDEAMVSFFRDMAVSHGKMYLGTIGSGDIYSREADRIRWMHEEKSELCEDMEAYAVYAACDKCGVPCVSVRIISNNELTGEAFNPATAGWLQKDIAEWLLQNGSFELEE